jgi:hypothetical protein
MTARLGWRQLVRRELQARGLTYDGLVAAAERRGVLLRPQTVAATLSGRQRLAAGFVGAVSIVLGVHPAELRFPREPRTELGFLAFERAEQLAGQEDGDRRAG